MTPTEPPGAQLRPAPQATAVPQTTHNSSPACATSRAYRRLYLAGSANVQCQARTEDSATAIAQPPTGRWPQSQSPRGSPPSSLASPPVIHARIPGVRTAPHHPPATSEPANTPEKCSTPDSSRWQKRSAPNPPKSSTADASAQQNRFVARAPYPLSTPRAVRATAALRCSALRAETCSTGKA